LEDHEDDGLREIDAALIAEVSGGLCPTSEDSCQRASLAFSISSKSKKMLQLCPYDSRGQGFLVIKIVSPVAEIARVVPIILGDVVGLLGIRRVRFG